MPRGKKKVVRECLVRFVTPNLAPAAMQPGKSATGVLVTVLEEDAKFITLQRDTPKRGRGTGVTRTVCQFSKDQVVLYTEEEIEIAPVEGVDGVVDVPAPKKRGRPAKAAAVKGDAKAPKKRGRPAKSDAAPKRRGRPPKSAQMEIVADEVDDAPAPKKRGRPAKAKSISDVPKEGAAPKKKRGRPAKKTVAAPPAPKKAKKEKKVKKSKKRFGSVKPDFQLDPDDE